MSKLITRYLSHLVCQNARCALTKPVGRGFQATRTISLLGTQLCGKRPFNTSRIRSDATTSETGGYRNRKSRVDFRTVLRDFLSHNHDVYESARHEGRPSINLRSSDPTDKTQIQKRLAFFIDAQTECELISGEPPLAMEIAKNVYIQLNSRIESNVGVTIEFDRSTAGNSLDSVTLESLASVFEGLSAVSSLRGVLLTASAGQKASRAFSCGANIKEMQQLRNADEATSFIRRISRVCTAIRQLQVPVVCGIDGAALGAGLEIAASCDIRVATRKSIFGMPEVNLAIPSVVEARLLCDIMGIGRTRHFLLTGESLNADTALNYGLVTELFDEREHLLAWSAKLLEKFCSSLNVHTEQKDLMRIWESSSLQDGITAGVSAFAHRFEGDLGGEVRIHMQSQWQRLKSGRG